MKCKEECILKSGFLPETGEILTLESLSVLSEKFKGVLNLIAFSGMYFRIIVPLRNGV